MDRLKPSEPVGLFLRLPEGIVSRRALLRWQDVLALAIVVAAGWWRMYGDGLLAGMPPLYKGDALMMLARIRAYAAGELLPFWATTLPRLNAPFQAVWADYPVEDLVYAPAGVLAAVFGLMAGSTLYLLLLHLAAGIAGYGAARLLSARRDYSIAIGILFGLAPYAFQRGLAHLNLTVYWHVPLLVVILVWCAWPDRVLLDERRGRRFAIGGALAGGILCPYYLAPFLLLLALICLGQLANRDRKGVRNALLIGAAAGGGLVLQSWDTILFALRHGANSIAVGRDYWGLVKFGFYVPDLIFPSTHRSALVQGWSRELYQGRVPPLLAGESQTAYIGIVSLIGFGWLMIHGVTRISARQFEKVSPLFWLALGSLAFAVAGGINYLLGAFGFLLLRSTNRVSILLSALALLFLAQRLPATRVGKIPWLIPVVMVIVGIYDQIPQFPGWELERRSEGLQEYRSDATFFRTLEERLPRKAMVFQLPVKPFPESDSMLAMGDYEHLRPWLHTADLRFSYGTVKGRGDTEWQDEVAAKPAAEMVAHLQRYGFAAILINRKAYLDKAALLSAGIGAICGEPWAENGDFVVFRLAPQNPAELPPMVHPVEWAYRSGFHAAERNQTDDWAWARGDATIRVRQTYRPPTYQPAHEIVRARLRFEIEPVQADREIRMRVGGQPERQIIAKEQRRATIDVEADIGDTPVDIHFYSSRASVLPLSDYRLLNFRLINPRLDVSAGGTAQPLSDRDD